ncbi:RNase P modulator RnpM [Pygmaiobacter massiliensis]|uniref:RNase P modulator RnpM n=1 Tax=Pygmaiobacter massiliensis TaxID=1917873 RepID=UPI0028A0C2CE|nr:YlxR family protein [Pygmaiobacter massiliensis]
MVTKKVPVRRCVGCNEGKPKKELVRVVKTAEGEISVDVTGKKSGRGAYLCPDKKCLAKAQKAKRLERAFECAISEEIYERLAQEVEAREDADE